MARAYLEITLQISNNDTAKAVAICTYYREPFLKTINGALSKELLIHQEDIQLLHSFSTVEYAQAYLLSELFTKEVMVAFEPFMVGHVNIKVYRVV